MLTVPKTTQNSLPWQPVSTTTPYHIIALEETTKIKGFACTGKKNRVMNIIIDSKELLNTAIGGQT